MWPTNGSEKTGGSGTVADQRVGPAKRGQRPGGQVQWPTCGSDLRKGAMGPKITVMGIGSRPLKKFKVMSF